MTGKDKQINCQSGRNYPVDKLENLLIKRAVRAGQIKALALILNF
jgi:hypothetical protein